LESPPHSTSGVDLRAHRGGAEGDGGGQRLGFGHRRGRGRRVRRRPLGGQGTSGATEESCTHGGMHVSGASNEPGRPSDVYGSMGPPVARWPNDTSQATHGLRVGEMSHASQVGRALTSAVQSLRMTLISRLGDADSCTLLCLWQAFQTAFTKPLPPPPPPPHQPTHPTPPPAPSPAFQRAAPWPEGGSAGSPSRGRRRESHTPGRA